jgi:predicted CoA-substrate-specific enzyme activase
MAPQATDIFLGIDVGSVTTKVVALTRELELLESVYLRTYGNPIRAVTQGLQAVRDVHPGVRVAAAATTGSGRTLAAKLVGAGLAKNEITTHTLAALHIVPDVQTIIEIGGQDSKVIIVRNGLAVDFAMNTVCAAGTGSFLDQQAGRLGLNVDELGRLALTSVNPLAISGRCTVFAETDMIHKQQVGESEADIVAGLCRSLVRNYLATVAKGKPLEPPVVFQGGVAANPAIVREFERQIGHGLTISPHFGVTGAYGAALLASKASGPQPEFRGFELLEREFRISSFVCGQCEEECTVLSLCRDGQAIAWWNDRCGRYSHQGAVDQPSEPGS